MKERPILFSAPMVRAILEGRKTQTRRIVKPQPNYTPAQESLRMRPAMCACPYGIPGDRLWVRETWRPTRSCFGNETFVRYRTAMDGNDDRRQVSHDMKASDKWKPSIHMPRWASRITLEITSIRVDRLQDISEWDAGEEGVPECGHNGYHIDQCTCSFSRLWESINGKGSWEANPWVWVIEFRRIDR